MPHALADGLRRRGVAVSTAFEERLLGRSDVDQLAHARDHQCVLVTQDADFLRLHRQGVTHAGIAYYAPGSRSIGELISALVLIHEVLSTDEIAGEVEWL